MDLRRSNFVTSVLGTSCSLMIRMENISDILLTEPFSFDENEACEEEWSETKSAEDIKESLSSERE